MNLKTKLYYGLGFLSLVMLFFGAISIFNLSKISQRSKAVLTAHEKSLLLERQQTTILSAEARRKLQNDNLNFLQGQNELAQREIQNAITSLIFSGSICALLLFSFVLNFPGFLFKSLIDLSAAIKQMSIKKSNRRSLLNTNDELAEFELAYNGLINQLNQWESSNLAELKSSLLSAETTIEHLNKTVAELRDLDKAKSNFMIMVAEELKSPVSSIKLSIRLMNCQHNGFLTRDQHAHIRHIQQDLFRLNKVSTELHDLSHAETGNLHLNFEKSDPRKLAIYAMDAVRYQAETKEIELELVSRNNLPPVNVDTDKTAWVLENFLSNAMRYSAERSKVVIEITELEDQIEFSVRDFGTGIAAQYQGRLFERYFKVPAGQEHKAGSGIGLAISKDFIEAESGKIWVESTIGKGSRFCFQLPIAG